MKSFKEFGEEHTEEQWKEMIKAIDSGEEVEISEWIYFYFLEVLPPIYCKGGFLLQEAVKFSDEGSVMRNRFYGNPKTGYFAQQVKTEDYVDRKTLIDGDFI